MKYFKTLMRKLHAMRYAIFFFIFILTLDFYISEVSSSIFRKGRLSEGSGERRVRRGRAKPKTRNEEGGEGGGEKGGKGGKEGKGSRSTVKFPGSAPKYLSPYSIQKLAECYKDRLESKANVTVALLGKTVEYNEIVLIKMVGKKKNVTFRAAKSDEKYANEEIEKKIVFIVHSLNVDGIQEVGCLYKQKNFDTLMMMYAQHLDKFDIFIIPMANPDGFATSNVMGKNNSPQSSCSGVYLDRNFDISWNESKRVNSCYYRYPGPVPFSEVESRAVRDIIHVYNNKLIAYIHVHPHGTRYSNVKGEAVLYPRGNAEVTTDDDKYVDMKGEIEEELKNVTLSDLPFEMTTLYNWYGHTSGSSVDYASQVYGVPFCMEFSMQPHTDMILNRIYEKYILKDIWGRIINVVFNNFQKHVDNANNIE